MPPPTFYVPSTRWGVAEEDGTRKLIQIDILFSSLGLFSSYYLGMQFVAKKGYILYFCLLLSSSKILLFGRSFSRVAGPTCRQFSMAQALNYHVVLYIIGCFYEINFGNGTLRVAHKPAV